MILTFLIIVAFCAGVLISWLITYTFFSFRIIDLKNTADELKKVSDKYKITERITSRDID